MEIIVMSVGSVFALFFLFIGWRNFKTNRNALKREKKLLDRLIPLLDKLEADELPGSEMIQELADDPFTRERLYFILTENELGHFFPEEYLNHQSAAESALVYWLNHGNELGDSPAEMIFMATVYREIEHEQIQVVYYVFKFRENNPSPGSHEWMVGIAGPYIAEEEPYTHAPGTFSTFEDYESKSPEEHVDWLHNMMLKKGLI
ncbi:MAG: hypothetical protein KDD99_25795 [Bacteroidetes bacterium]|nr:hypothetical protein [Bacteroidota bacterium]